MINSEYNLANRATSSYNISIGTALALESFKLGPEPVYDSERQIPNSIDINNYKFFYINLMTLFRNILGAVGSSNVDSLLPGDIVYVLEEEVRLIRDLISEISLNKTKAIFYASNYTGLKSKYPNASIRVDRTDKQKSYTLIMQLVINEFIKRQDKSNIEFFDCDFNPTNRSEVLILSHYAYDLINHKRFSKFDLLESHTGLLKTPSMFYTKLINGKKDLARIQLNKMSIQIFGDKETFAPLPISIRKLVLELSEKYSWTQTTQRDRYLFCFDTIGDLELSKMLKSMV